MIKVNSTDLKYLVTTNIKKLLAKGLHKRPDFVMVLRP